MQLTRSWTTALAALITCALFTPSLASMDPELMALLNLRLPVPRNGGKQEEKVVTPRSAVKFYNLINHPDFAEYDEFEAYMDELYGAFEKEIEAANGGSDAGSVAMDYESDGDEAMVDAGAFMENKLFKARGDLMDAEFALRDCQNQLGMCREIESKSWEEFQQESAKPAEEEEYQYDAETNSYIRPAMRTGYFDQLVGGVDLGVGKIVDIRKLWCLDERADRIGQSEAEIIKSVLIAHATDVSLGGEGILHECKRAGREETDQPGVKEIKEIMDEAYKQKSAIQATREPMLLEKVAELQNEVDRVATIVQDARRRKEAALKDAQSKAEQAAQAAYDAQLEEFWAEERLMELQAQEQRLQKEKQAEAKRKSDLDARRRDALAARYGQQMG